MNASDRADVKESFASLRAITCTYTRSVVDYSQRRQWAITYEHIHAASDSCKGT